MYGREKESGGGCVCVCAQRVRERTWSSARLHLMLAGYAAPPKNFVENFVVRKGERESERGNMSLATTLHIHYWFQCYAMKRKCEW